MEDAGDLHDNLAAADRAGTVAFIAFFRASPAVSIRRRPSGVQT